MSSIFAPRWSVSRDDAGYMSSLHALLPVTFRIDGQPGLAIEFVVDTGFTGFLTLPVPVT